jgi:osmotically-inducible protein OsmY
MYVELLDRRIKREIQSEMRFVPGIDPGDVTVTVDDGVATLTGHVDRPSSRQAAEELARWVPCVRAVANEIQVRPPSGIAQHEVGLVRALVDAFGRG